MLDELSRTSSIWDRSGLHELRPYIPMLAAAIAELPLVGTLVKVPNEALKQLAAERNEKEQQEWFERLFAVGEQTNVDIAVLTVLAAGMFVQQAELFALLRKTGSQVERDQLTEFAKLAAIVAYRSRIAREYQYADHRGIEGITRAAHVTSLELDDIYVVPHLVAENDRVSIRERERELLRMLTRESDFTPEERARMEEEYAVLTGERWAGEKSATKGIPLGHALQVHRHAVIIGSPGVGKSTLSRYLARVCALGRETVRERLQWEDGPLPVLIPLALFAEERRKDPDLALCSFLEQRMRDRGGDALHAGAVEALGNGTLLVILDGVDEVPESHARAAAVQAVDEFIAAHASNRVVVTSRPFGYIPVRGDVPHFQLPNFTRTQVREFVGKWQRACEAKQHPDAPDYESADRDAKSLIEELQRNPKVAELATNPLMLVIVSLIRYEKARLPEERVQLYNKAVNTLMDTWNHWRSLPGKDVGGVTLPLGRLVRVWGTIAEWTRRTNNTGIMHRAELKLQLVQVLKRPEYDEEDPEATAESYLRAAADRAGLIEERGTNIFAFWHPTFEEFLAAVELATPTGDAARRLLHVADDPRWREVILLAVGYVGVVQRDNQTASSIVTALLEDQLPDLEPLTHSRLQLAAACIADDVGVRRATAQIVIMRLAEVVQDYPYRQLTSAFVHTVRSLPRLRPEASLVSVLEPLTAHPNWEIRMEAARLLANAAPSDVAAVQLCRILLDDSDAAVRCHAALGLARAAQYSAAVWLGLSGFQDQFAHAQFSVREYLADAPVEALKDLLGSFEVLDPRGREDHLELLRVMTLSDSVVRSLAAAYEGEPHGRTLRAAKLLREVGYAGQAFSGSWLIPLLEAEDAYERSEAESFLLALPPTESLTRELLPRLDVADDDARLRVAKVLRVYGYEGEELIHGLIRLLENGDPRVHSPAVALLERLPPSDALLAGVANLLARTAPETRIRAADLLCRFGYNGKDLICALVTLLEDENSHVRDAAIRILKHLPPTEVLVSELAGRLNSAVPPARLEVVRLLRKLEYQSEGLIYALVQLLEDGDPMVCSGAAALLKNLPRSEALVAVLVAQLRIESPDVRIRVAGLLRAHGYEGEELPQALVPLLRVEGSQARSQALELLKGLPPSAPLAKMLVPLLQAKDRNVWFSAAGLLKSLPLPKELAGELVPLLEIKDHGVRHQAAGLIKRLPWSERLENLLTARLGHDDPDVRLRAAGILHTVGHPKELLVSPLMPLLDHAEVDVRLRAATLLRSAGYEGEVLVRALMLLLEESDADVCGRAVGLLERLPPSAVLVGELLVRVSATGTPAAANAARILAKIPPSGELVTACLALLDSKDAGVRIRAARLLQYHGHESEKLFREAVHLLDVEDTGVHAAAITLLRSVIQEVRARREQDTPAAPSSWRVLLNPIRERLGRPTMTPYQVLLSSLEALIQVARPNVRIEAARLLRDAGYGGDVLVPALAPLLEEANPVIRSVTTRMLRELDSPAVLQTVLVPLLRTHDPQARLEIAKLLRSTGYVDEQVTGTLLALLEVNHASVRLEAASMLRGLGYHGEPLPSTLATLLEADEPVTRSAAMRALRQLSPSELPTTALVQLLGSAEESVRLDTVHLLGRAGYSGEPLENVLVSLLGSADEDAAAQAETMLAAMPQSEVLGSKLRPLLRSEDPRIRLAAAKLLRRMECFPEEMANALVELLGNPDAGVRCQAADLMTGMLTPEALHGRVAKLLEVDDEYIRLHVAGLLCGLGCSGEELENVVVAMLESKSPVTRDSAARLLQGMPSSDRLLAKVVRLLGAARADLRQQARKYLGPLDHAGEEVENALLELLGTRDLAARSEAALLLKRLPRSQVLLGKTVSLLRSEDVGVQLDVARLLRELEFAGEELQHTLVMLVGRDDPQARADAATLLRGVQLSAEPLEGLISLLRAAEEHVRLEIAELLLSMGYRGAAWFSGLEPMLASKDLRVRVEAARLLLNSGYEGRLLIGTLMRLCEAEDMEVRFRAHEILQQLQPSKALVYTLLSFLDGDDLRVRATAAGLLRRWDQSEDASVRALVALLRTEDVWLQAQSVNLLEEWGQSEALVNALLPLLKLGDTNLHATVMRLLGRQRDSDSALLAMLGVVTPDALASRAVLTRAAEPGGAPAAEDVSFLAELVRAKADDNATQQAAREWLYEWFLERVELREFARNS
jgi:hypothetical protein